ncbi:MAG TPA: hypothetical protein VMH01_15640 [Puia sp.]|nr:hypothetical protein [Puia sp.]
MRKIFLLILFFSSVNCILAQEACNDALILQVKGSWKKDPDANMNAGKNITVINNRIDNISELFKTAYPDPRGIEAKWYRSMGAYQINKKITAYSFQSLYLPWYCNQHLKKMMKSDETGTWVIVSVNSFGDFLTDQYDMLQIHVHENPVYLLPKQNGEWKGYPLYQTRAWRERNYCIIIMHEGQLPWKAITQEQYLKAIRAQWEEQKTKLSAGYAINEDNLKKSIADNEKNPNLKEADKEKINASLQKQLEEIQKEEKENAPKMNKGMDDKIAVIDNYLSKTNSSTLQGPAIMDRNTAGDFRGTFSTDATKGITLVTVNPDYFDNKLPDYTPQLMVLLWRWDNNAPSMDFKKQFEENFPVEKLRAMLDK